MKIDGGTIGILDNPTALLKWAVAGPIISSMLNEGEGEFLKELVTFRSHHEDTASFEKAFKADSQSLLNAFIECGNPFQQCKNSLVHLTSRHVLDEKSSRSVMEAQKIGQKQYELFISKRLQKKNASIYDNIKKNNLSLFRQKNSIVTTKSSKKIRNLTSDRRLYANLYVACQSRKGDLDNFFAHENHAFPISISEYGNLRKCTAKSDFLQCLEVIEETMYEAPSVDAKILDGAAFVNMNVPKRCKNYGEYCDVLKQKIQIMARDVTRLDVVFDTYKEKSIKSQTRESRGHGVRVLVQKQTPIHKNFHEFMRNDQNKTELFQMIADSLIEIQSPPKVISTKLKHVVANVELDIDYIDPCNHEEADTRVILHVYDASLEGLKKISIVTVDTDVVIIALYHFFSLNLEELWIEFGTGQHRRYLPIHKYATSLKEEICRAMPFWYAVTGCDTVSMFAGRGKKTAWQVWSNYPEATEVFVRLPVSEILDDEDMRVLERFVILLYDSASTCVDVNECRRMLFTKKARAVEAIPPTKDALIQHILRAMLQSSIWSRAIDKWFPEFDVTQWGWKDENDLLTPQWTTLSEASKACEELIKCSCKFTCGNRCRCKKSELSCTELCNCGGGC